MKVRELKLSDGSRYGWSIRCPACDDFHVLSGWTFNGDVNRPTFSPSLLVRYRDGDRIRAVCHSFIRDGRIQYLSDCTHAMAGTTHDLPEHG